MQNSERALVPLPSELAGLKAPDGRIDVPRLLAAAAFGLAVEAQRRSLDAAATVVTRFGSPLGILARPAVGSPGGRWRWRDTISALTAGRRADWLNNDVPRSLPPGPSVR